MATQERTPRFTIGTQYRPIGRRNSYVCTVTDILTTRNTTGDIVDIRYESEHAFAGQMVKARDVIETTIARGLIY